jgi:hypothetical protein|tara:strand:+ start:213 stop:425 length:213 start_codon:yes stop_codon:yes gene_type:complete
MKLAFIVGAMALILGVASLIALPVMLLWNWIMPELTVEPLFAEIGFWRAFGLSLLFSLLFKSSKTHQMSK